MTELMEKVAVGVVSGQVDTDQEISAWDQVLITADAYKHELEEAAKRESLKNPKNAYTHALKVVGGRWEEGEQVIAQSAEYSYKYAWLVLRRQRFPKGEAAIAKDKVYAFEYAQMFKDVAKKA